jgi:putative ATP-binding cassette transporter
MLEQASPPADPAEHGHVLPAQKLVPQLVLLARVLLTSPQRVTIVLLNGGLIAVVGATALMQIRLNAWNQPFYDALQRRDLSAFLDQLVVFALLAGVLLGLNVAQSWLNQMTRLKLREWLVRDLFDAWLKPGRAFRLASAGDIGANPDQRVHEDSRHLTELTTDLGIGLLQSSLLLLCFIGVLWGLSQGVIFHLHGRSFAIPGYMVWAALIYAGTASWLSWRVGRPLIHLQEKRYGEEAELRYALVRFNESVDTVTVYGGEAEERRRLDAAFGSVLTVTRRIVAALARLTWVTSGYGWFTIIAPIVVAAPGYFEGELTFGEMMVAVGAFIQVQQALRWFVDNFSSIADWQATLVRVTSFRRAVVATAHMDGEASEITYVSAPEERMTLDDLEIASGEGCTMLSEAHVVLGRGERVLIVGEPGTGKTLLFRAIARLWPWGSGRIGLPASQRLGLVPRRPYVPPGTLRAALAYPQAPDTYGDAELAAALRMTALERLVGSLDRSARWERELSEEEQQGIAFARVLLQKPRWVVIDEALDSLDDDTRRSVMGWLAEELSDPAIIYIGRPGSDDSFFTRVLHLVKDPGGRKFTPAHRVAAAARRQAASASVPT